MPVKRKKQCPISRAKFRKQAPPKLPVTIAGLVVGAADAREFATGSFGWYYGGKQNLVIGGVIVTVQVGVNITVVGSRDLPF